MARSKKSIKSIAAQVVRRAPIRTTPKKQRTGRKDIKNSAEKGHHAACRGDHSRCAFDKECFCSAETGLS